MNNKIIAPVLGVDPSEQARTAAAPYGIETAPGPTRSRWKRCWRMSEALRRSSARLKAARSKPSDAGSAHRLHWRAFRRGRRGEDASEAGQKDVQRGADH